MSTNSLNMCNSTELPAKGTWARGNVETPRGEHGKIGLCKTANKS